MEHEQAPYEPWIGLPWSEWDHEINELHRQLLQDFLAVAQRSNVSMESIQEGAVNMTGKDWSMRPENEHSVRPLQRAYFALWRVAEMIQEGPEVQPLALLKTVRVAHREIRSAEGRIGEEYQGEAVNLQRAMMAKKAAIRHAGHSEARQLVEEYWWQQKDALGFKTMEQAGDRLAKWLQEEHGHTITDKTVSRWLSEFAASKGFPRYYQGRGKQLK